MKITNSYVDKDIFIQIFDVTRGKNLNVHQLRKNK